MDPNPKRFPVLSYVMSRLQSSASQSAPDQDIEAPAPAPTTAVPSFTTLAETELVERMPQLCHPDILASMARAVSDVAQTRSVLRALGKRPDHEAVDAARSLLADIDANLLLHDGDMEFLGKAEAEKSSYKAIVKLDEMHEAYENLLREAEERLVKIYGSAAEGSVRKVLKEEEVEGEEVDEEVVSVLRQVKGKCLERVELSGRRLRLLPEEFGRMRGLVSLDVSNNRLEVIPDAIAGLEQLAELYLSSNSLMSLPDSIGLLINLKILDVSSNKLKALPDSISYCRSLVELNASYNELTYLPTNIGYELENLQKLWIFLNKLRSLPASICEMRSLRLLDAHFNELNGLPYAIGNLTCLETLNLSSNFSDMKELPPTFGDLINLKELDLSNNQIHALPDSFGHLEKLSILKLDQNPFVIPPMEIVNQGVQAVKMYMSKRWLDILIDEEQKNQIAGSSKSNTGWLTRSTSWLSNFATGVSGSVAEYLGTGETSYKDPCLDQQL